ncbi:MAG: CMP/dCMP kinase [Solirubrobacteraceae bacterium]|nr:CMP/dCMP kinase [Solirubrobacteraceae bacterium]
MVIAIDGPAGAGKSTVARAVAARLGFTYLDTGAMYRAVAVTGTADCEIAFDGDRVLVDGRDVTAAIRTPEAAHAASLRAGDPAVRAVLVAKQQALLTDGDWVAEGRDIATVVKPDAEVKVYLTASPEERAQRREVSIDELHERDQRDQGHGRSTLEPAPGAATVDSTGMTLDEVVERIAGMARSPA